MVDIPQDLKERLKQERLQQYQSQLYALQMDLTAYKAIGDEKAIEQTKKAIEQGEAAYKAVEAM